MWGVSHKGSTFAVLNVRVHDLLTDLLSGWNCGSHEDQLRQTLLNPILGKMSEDL